MTSETGLNDLTREQIESALAGYFGRKFCVLTFRGTAALAAAFHALDRPGAAAVFPAAMCSIPVFAAPFAGWRPVFADVDPDDGNLSLADVERVLEADGNAGAVVPVHMFGQPDRVEELRALCDRRGAALIEDVALSMGAARNGRPAGSFGRIACLSFVRKMLPLEMGGAVLTDEPALARRAREFVDRLPPPPPNVRDRTAAAMKDFHVLTGEVAAGGWKRVERLRPFEDRFRELMLARTVDADWRDSIVLRELASLADVVRARRARAEVFETALNHPRLKALRHDGSCFFAYPVRLDGAVAEDFLLFAEANGCSFRRIAYPDVHGVFGEYRPDRYPNARAIERELVGLPVDDDQPVSAFWEYAEDFQRLFTEYLEALPRRDPFDWEGKLEMRMS